MNIRLSKLPASASLRRFASSRLCAFALWAFSFLAVALPLLTACAHNHASYIQEHQPISDTSVFKLTEKERKNLAAVAPSDPEAAFRLYEYFQYYRPDETQALYWLRVSAEQGYSPAEYSLGIYLTFLPTGVDYTEAKKWLQKAADQGDPDAIKALAQLKAQKR